MADANKNSAAILNTMRLQFPENLTDGEISNLEIFIKSAQSAPENSDDPDIQNIYKNFKRSDFGALLVNLRDYKKKKEIQGGTLGLRLNKKTIFKINKPGIVDGRTCYQVGPLKWCNRKKSKTKTGGKKLRTRKNYKK